MPDDIHQEAIQVEQTLLQRLAMAKRMREPDLAEIYRLSARMRELFAEAKLRKERLLGHRSQDSWVKKQLGRVFYRSEFQNYARIGDKLLRTSLLTADELNRISPRIAYVLTQVVEARGGELPRDVREAALDIDATVAKVKDVAKQYLNESVDLGTPTLEDLSRKTYLSVQELEDLRELLEQKKQVIIEGPPGSGKTYLAENFARYFTESSFDDESHTERVKIVQFHQSYGYEDFVQGIRPETTKGGHLKYEVKDGVFKRFSGEAEQDEENKYVMIVDEINRGNISRIFGELLLLLEYRDKRIALQYEKPEAGEYSIPSNLYVIGTMNTTDRSLAQIDYAFRRRFGFYRLTPVTDGKAPVLESWLSDKGVPADTRERILQIFVELNERIRAELGEHFLIGHSYFMGAPDELSRPGALRRIWTHAIGPLLEEYFYNSRKKDSIIRELRQLFDERPQIASGVGKS